MLRFHHFFLDATIATPPPTPVFSLSNERSFDGSPRIDVVFANGKSDSMIFSMSDDDFKMRKETGIDECRYMGHMENDEEACISKSNF